MIGVSPGATVNPAFSTPSRNRRAWFFSSAPAVGLDRNFQRLQGSRGERGRKRIGKEIGPGALAQEIDDRLVGGDEAAHAAAERLAERAGDDVYAVARAGQRRRSATLLAEMPGRMAVVDQDQRAVTVGKFADLLQLGDIAVHREYAVAGDELEPRARGVGLLQAVLELVHVRIGEAVALRLAEPHAVDDRGVVEAVGNDRVLFAQQRLEHAAIGVETGGEHDRIRLAQVLGDRLLELTMQRLRSADEAHGSHAKAELLHGAARRRDDVRVIGEAEIIVGAEIDRIARALRGRDMDAPALRPGQQPLALREALPPRCRRGWRGCG